MARCLYNPALLDNAQGKYPEAEPLVKRALAVREKSLGPDHPDLSRVFLMRSRMAGPGSLCKPLRVWQTTPAGYWEPTDPPKQ